MDALRNLYCTLVLPYLSYCAMVLGNTYTTNLLPLYLKQKKPLGLNVIIIIIIIMVIFKCYFSGELIALS